MKPSQEKRIRHLLHAMMAGTLALSLAACQKAPDEASQDGGQASGSVTDKAGQPMGAPMSPPATSAAETKIDQMKDAISDKTAEAGKAMDDAALTAKVKSALIAEPGLKALSISVDTAGGIVTLQGKVDTPANRDKAAHVAAGVEGVKSVNNRLEIGVGS